MRNSLVTSAVMHGAALAFALVSIGSPEPFEMTDVEALPVDIVPVSELTQIQQGDRNAPLADRAAPVPTTNPRQVENAENLGDNNVDLRTPPTPQNRPREQEVAAAPMASEKPAPVQDTKPTESNEIVKEDTAPPVPDVRPEPKPQTPPPEPKAEAPPPEPAPEPAPPEPAAAPPPEPQPAQSETGEIAVPQNVPVPNARPRQEPPKPTQTAVARPTETRQREQAPAPSNARPDNRRQEAARSSSTRQNDFSADEVAALLNKTDAQGGGARRSADDPALGGRRTTGGSTLSQSELDALRSQIQRNWSVISGIEGAEGVIIRVTMRLDQSGEIIGQPDVEASGGSESARRTLQSSALRAVRRSAPFRGLPADKYDAWSEVVVNFDPSELL
ncbi:TonB C-terminal domain-containing protein [Rhizobiaceae bacterium BDR2-2]|uniref:TonB C-terminal domain-containing protein n=1 Tax=Ectorhizobium quercum TaxID=2965071 RepID=A0AAE3SU22_9HYPH|nr:hypothetical protein [Ectorhizobium quercum]MCX8996770.1 TonB C-terminal domain-containing protein [Ectorhizobium quercum]